MASIIYGHNGTLAYLSTCRMCRKSITIENVPTDGYANWRKGEPIATALPSLTADDREFLISQHCGPCFDSIHPEE